MAKKVILKDDNVEIMPITRGELVLDSSGQQAFHSSQFLATQSQPGLMSAADKTKLDVIKSTTIDSALSTTSDNAVKNKVVTAAINEAKTLANNAQDAADNAQDTANSAQGIANAIKSSYLKSASVSGNQLTLTDQDDEETKFNNTTYTFNSGSDGSFTVTPAGGEAQTITVGGVLTDDKVKQTNTTSSGSYRLLFSYTADNTTRTEGARKSSKLLFNPSTGALTATSFSGKLTWANLTDVPESFTPSTHNHSTAQINALTNYSKATSASDLTTTDTLNVALGKLEYKADTAYTWYKSITDTDTDDVINKWSEVVDFVNNLEDDVLETFVTTNTKQTITGEKTFSGTSASLLTIDRNSTSPAWIRFLKNGTLLGYLGVSNDNKAQFNNGSNTYDILHSGNAHIKNGVITINGATITPITSHQSLSNYVTLTGNQEISGVKTFTSQQKFTVAQGTSPFTVTSKTTVANLSAALLDGTAKSGLLTGFANVNTTNNPNSISVTVGGTTKYLAIAYAKISGQVSKNLVLKIKSGSTEGTNLYTYNGSTAKTLNIVAGSNITLTAEAGKLTIASSYSNTTYTLSGTLSGNTFVSTLKPSSGNNTTSVVPAMTAATASAAGKAGLVPAPSAGSQNSFLRGDGTWVKVDAGTVISLPKELTVTADWMDTGIDGDDLETGTYIVQVSCAANNDALGYDCYWSGIMSWWKGRTNDTESDEILLHRTGRSYANTIYLRTIMRSNTDTNGLKLQIAANTNIGTKYIYTFKFKKVI